MNAHKPSLPRLFLPMTVLLLASFACAIPGLSRTPTSQSEDSSPTAAPQADSPAGLVSSEAMDIYQQRLQSGEWHEGQGLLLLMQVAGGEKSTADVFGDQEVNPMELNRLLAHVNVYLSKNPDAPEAADLKRLTAMLVPSVEAIMKYAAPEGSASVQKTYWEADLQLSPSKTDEECAQLWADGFPAPAPGQTPPVCVLYKTFQVLGKTYRIFYPKNNAGSAANATNLVWAQAALTDAAKTYNSIDGKTLPDTDLIYGVTPGGALAEAAPKDGTCQMHIYPSMASSSEGDFKQTLAHEVFHCYQVFFLPEPTEANIDDQVWWVEGSAEYFSNVVYPTYNSEWKEIKDFDAQSVKNSLFEMSYANTFFFQYMANQLGDKGVMDVLNGLPDYGPPAAYAAALEAHIPNFPEFFDNYARAYLDYQITDTDGEIIPLDPQPGDEVDFAGDGVQPLETRPFVITRYKLVYSKGTFTQSEETTGQGMDEARMIYGSGDWGSLPGTVETNCGKRPYLMLMTSVDPGGNYMTTITFTHKDPPPGTECSACLVGDWRIDTMTFDNYMATMIKPPAIHVLATADLTIHFDENGSMLVSFNKVTELFGLHQTDINNQDQVLAMLVTMTGTISSSYSVHDDLISTSNGSTNIQASFQLNGMDMGGNPIDNSTMGSWYGFVDSDRFECDENVLTLIPLATGSNAPEMIYYRITNP